MILIKSFLISVFIIEGFVCSIKDIKMNKIPNQYILYGLICAVLGNILYFTFSGGEAIFSLLAHILFSLIIAFLMYALHIWAGGDVKLFVLFSMLIPVEFLKHKIPLSIITIFIITFSLAFFYLVVESLIFTLKKENKFLISRTKIPIKYILSCSLSIISLQFILRMAFEQLYFDYLPLFLFLNVIFVLIFDKLKFLQNYISIIICAIVSVTSVFFSVANGNFSVDIKSIIITIVVILFRMLAEKFNYQEIKTTDVKAGMILSYGSIISFMNSKVKGLPKSTTEDIASRITAEEAESIIRWASSKNGQETIVVMRKMPFAAFISLGFFIYLVLGVFVW